MERALSIVFGAYRVVRVPDAGARAKARRAGTRHGGARYTVVRPDGSELCCAVSWGEVERLIEGDVEGAENGDGRVAGAALRKRKKSVKKKAKGAARKRAG